MFPVQYVNVAEMLSGGSLPQSAVLGARLAGAPTLPAMVSVAVRVATNPKRVRLIDNIVLGGLN